MSLALFCRAHGWTIGSICEGLGIDDETLKRQVDLTPRQAHGQMVAMVWREMFECAMSRNPDRVHPALKAKALVFLGERLIPEQLVEPQQSNVVTIDQISPETVIRALLSAVEKPADKKVILDAVARHREREETQSGEQS